MFRPLGFGSNSIIWVLWGWCAAADKDLHTAIGLLLSWLVGVIEGWPYELTWEKVLVIVGLSWYAAGVTYWFRACDVAFYFAVFRYRWPTDMLLWMTDVASRLVMTLRSVVLALRKCIMVQLYCLVCGQVLRLGHCTTDWGWSLDGGTVLACSVFEMAKGVMSKWALGFHLLGLLCGDAHVMGWAMCSPIIDWWPGSKVGMGFCKVPGW
ncbi:hypothetical protein R6Q59_023573 [Mikania micrantha]